MTTVRPSPGPTCSQGIDAIDAALAPHLTVEVSVSTASVRSKGGAGVPTGYAAEWGLRATIVPRRSITRRIASFGIAIRVDLFVQPLQIDVDGKEGLDPAILIDDGAHQRKNQPALRAPREVPTATSRVCRTRSETAVIVGSVGQLAACPSDWRLRT